MRKVDALSKYAEDLNTWVRSEGGLIKLGVTDWAQEYMGEVSSVSFELVENQITGPGMIVAILESDKATTEVISPLGGKVVALNEDLLSKPVLINEDCYHRGWLISLSGVPTVKYDQLKSAIWYEDAIGSFFRKSPA